MGFTDVIADHNVYFLSNVSDIFSQETVCNANLTSRILSFNEVGNGFGNGKTQRS